MKCLECKGVGHTKFECPNKSKLKEKSLISFSDSESDDEGEELLNFVAFMASSNSSKFMSDTDSDCDEELNPKDKYRVLYDSWVQLSKDKLKLVKEKLTLEAKLANVSTEDKQKLSGITVDGNSQDYYQKKLDCLQKECHRERDRTKLLERELNDKYKQIRMLNKGLESLDKILAMGRTDSQQRGLGYQGYTGKIKKEEGRVINFVSGGSTSETVVRQSYIEPKKQVKSHVEIKRESVVRTRMVGVICCDHCGKRFHMREQCYKFKEKVRTLWNLAKCFIEPSRFCTVWIKKKDLYGDMEAERYNHKLERMYEEEEMHYASCCNQVNKEMQDEARKKDDSFGST